MVSRAMTAIVSNRKKMSSRLVSSPLQSFCKMRRKKWTRSNLGEGEVGSVFIGDWLVVQRLCDSPVAWVDRHDITLVDLDVQPLRVDVVRFAEASSSISCMTGVVVSRTTTTASSYSMTKPKCEHASAQPSMLLWIRKSTWCFSLRVK